MPLLEKKVLELEIHILIFIRSLRESNFQLHLAVLRYLLAWHFSLDHYNYSRWLSVHFFDLLHLETNSPDIFNHFSNGFFTFQKTMSEFSCIALDQVHEQNNTIIKGIGGATHVVNRSDESPLIRWELCAGELSKLLRDFEETPSETSVAVKKHHEDNPAFRKRFNNDINRVASALRNPFLFENTNLTAVNNINKSINEEIEANIRIIPEIGEKQFENFWTDRLILTKVPVNKIIKSNNLKLPGSTDNSKDKNIDPVLNSTMIAKLRSAADYRLHKVQQLFEKEVFGIAQSISVNNITIYHGKKADIQKCFETCIEPKHKTLQNTGICIDLSSMIRAKANKTFETFQAFGDYMNSFIASKI